VQERSIASLIERDTFDESFQPDLPQDTIDKISIFRCDNANPAALIVTELALNSIRPALSECPDLNFLFVKRTQLSINTLRWLPPSPFLHQFGRRPQARSERFRLALTPLLGSFSPPKARTALNWEQCERGRGSEIEPYGIRTTRFLLLRNAFRLRSFPSFASDPLRYQPRSFERSRGRPIPEGLIVCATASRIL
jgi:hypothetical protein